MRRAKVGNDACTFNITPLFLKDKRGIGKLRVSMRSIEGFKLAQLSHHSTRTRSSGSENCTVDRSRTRRARLLSSEMGHLMSDGIEWPSRSEAACI